MLSPSLQGSALLERQRLGDSVFVLLILVLISSSSCCCNAFSPVLPARTIASTLQQQQRQQQQQDYSTTALFAISRKQRVKRILKKRQKDALLNKDEPKEPEEEGKIPANLRRKISAKRQPMGHIVPRAVRVKGSGGSANPRLRPQGKAREAGLNNPSMLKILGGTAKGRRLDSPEVYLRPMMGKVREAVFSTFISFGLYEEIKEVRHLDVFAGSGSVGLESLSRGAAHCTFVDFSNDCCNAIKRNLKWCEFPLDKHAVVCNDAIKVLKNPAVCGVQADKKFDIVTLCPPYEEVIYANLMEAVANSVLVGPDTVVLVEYPIELGCLPHVIEGKQLEGEYVPRKLIGLRNRRYGRTVIAMYMMNPSGDILGADSRPEEFIAIK